MITLKPNDVNPAHSVVVVKPIGNFLVGDRFSVRISPMHGRRYNPGKDSHGKWLDTDGRPEDRYMVYMGEFYAVGTKEEIDAAFNES